MAITRKNIKRIALGNLVKSRVDSFVESRNRIRDFKEADFLTRVVNDGLSYQDQMDYYKAEMKKEKDKNVPDNTYIKAIKKTVAGLGKLNRQKKFRDGYSASITNLNTQRKGIDDHLRFLELQKLDATDPSLISEIDTRINEAKQEQFNIRNTAVINRAQFALQDKTIPALEKSINDVKSRRNLALGSDNDAEVAKWDQQLLSLQSQLGATKIENSYNDLSVNNMKQPINSVGMLNFLKENLKGSVGDTTALNVDGKRYKSISEYWQAQMNDYVQNTFFSAYQTEKNNEIETNSQKLTPVLESGLREMNIELDELASSSELAPFAQQFDQMKTAINFNAVNKIGSKVQDDYLAGRLSANSIENFNISRAKLDDLNKLYNVDVSQYLTAITADLASKKEAAAGAISQLAVQEGISIEEAASQLKITDIPTAKIAEAKVSEIAETITPGEETKPEFDISGPTEVVEETPKTEVPEAEIPETKVEEVKPFANEQVEEKPVASPDISSIQIKTGDTLSGIASRFGTNIETILKANPNIKDPNLIIAGESLNIPGQIEQEEEEIQ